MHQTSMTIRKTKKQKKDRKLFSLDNRQEKSNTEYCTPPVASWVLCVMRIRTREDNTSVSSKQVLSFHGIQIVQRIVKVLNCGTVEMEDEGQVDVIALWTHFTRTSRL